VKATILCRDVISFFPRSGGNFDRLPRGGQKMKKTKFSLKTQKITIFQNQEGANAPPCPPK